MGIVNDDHFQITPGTAAMPGLSGVRNCTPSRETGGRLREATMDNPNPMVARLSVMAPPVEVWSARSLPPDDSPASLAIQRCCPLLVSSINGSDCNRGSGSLDMADFLHRQVLRRGCAPLGRQPASVRLGTPDWSGRTNANSPSVAGGICRRVHRSQYDARSGKTQRMPPLGSGASPPNRGMTCTCACSTV